MMKIPFFILVLSILLTNIISGQSISGTVYDTKYDRPVENANILVVASESGSHSDVNGFFNIPDIPPGNYTIRVTMIGYLDFEKEISVTDEGISNLSIYLQPTNISLNNEFAVTARRIETEEFSSPEAITVLNNRTLEEESSRSTPEALQGATGVFVQKTNHGGGSPFIRGLTGNQNLLMIDGIRLNNATCRYGPNQYLSTIDPLIIHKIEIVRGAGSVLYGSDAVGGVVNVITKEPAYSQYGWKMRGALAAKWMSDDMQQTTRLECSAANEKIAFQGGVGFSNFGDIVGGDTTGKQTPTGYKEFSGDLKLKMKLSHKNELAIAYQYDKQTDVPRYDKIIANYSKYHFDPQIRQLGYARLKSNFSSKWLRQITFTGSFNGSDETRILQKNGSAKTSNEHDVVSTFGASAEVISQPETNWHFVSGIEYYFDKVKSDITDIENEVVTTKRGYYPDGATSRSFAMYSSHTLDFNEISFILGGRFNTYKIQAEDKTFSDVDVSPVSLVGSFSAIYHFNENYNLIGSLYSAFRAPNLNDLSSFGTFNAGIEVPNPDLKPEKSINAELGVKLRYDKLSGSVFVFRNKLTDLISRVESTYSGQDSIDGEKVYTKMNFEKAYIQGTEAELQYEFTANLSAFGNLTYTYGENISAEEPMSRIPPLNGKIGIYYHGNKGFWSKLEWLAAGKQDRLSSGDISDSRIPEGGTPGWSIFNFRAGYNFKWLEINAGINNILNEDYRTHGSGINGYGRCFWIGMKIGV